MLPGALLDADHPDNGVLIPCRNTVAYVITKDGARALRLSRALAYGMVAVNRVKITGGPIPFGGWKQSGIGREGARHGMEAFTELKYLCIDTAA